VCTAFSGAQSAPHDAGEPECARDLGRGVVTAVPPASRQLHEGSFAD
jgi:hypothetical protein